MRVSANRLLTNRAAIVRAVRNFFDERGFVEVETPVLIAAPAPEEYIETIPAEGGFLRASPELQMKQLLADGFEKIYQLGACFRGGEFGHRHRPEFTMLEWYQAGIDYRELMDFTIDLVRNVAAKNLCQSFDYLGTLVDLNLEPELITVNDAYLRYAGVPWLEALASDQIDELMTTAIEPALNKSRMTFLIDYPAERAALARIKTGHPEVAERWELYIGGMEVANAYGELTDAVEQKQRFRHAATKRNEQGMAEYPEPDSFFAALEYGMPECAGCAFGIDRLVMLLTGVADIAEIKFKNFANKTL